MDLTPDIFKIDPATECARIAAFLREKMGDLNREGIVVAISGGLDSSTVLSLCVRAVGRGRVTGLLLPEKHGNPDAAHFARGMGEALGVKTVVIDISKILSALGTYDFIADRVGSRAIVKKAVDEIPGEQKKAYFIAGIQGSGIPLVRQGLASMYSKHRIRMTVVYKVAEEQNLLVAGCAHQSEDLVGLFSKYGVDDAADVMPLKHLCRSQILQLARHLGVPEAILDRSPNPDMLPGIEDKYRDILGIGSDTLDLLLYGLEHGMAREAIARQIGLDPEKVREIEELMKSTEHMRHHAYSLMDQRLA